MDSFSTLSLMFGLAILALTASILAPRSADGRLKRNTMVGLRTRHTLSSDEAWLAAHHHAAPMLRVTAWTGWILLVIAAVFSLLKIFPAAFVVATAGFIACLALLLVAGFRANNVAKQYPTA